MRIYLYFPHVWQREKLVAEAFASNFVAPLGPQLDAFEASVREYLQADVHCVDCPLVRPASTLRYG